MEYMFAAWTVSYYIAYPVFYILNLVLSVLAIITAPLLYLGHFSLYACWQALRVLEKFEASQANLGAWSNMFHGPLMGLVQTLYIFFGIAALVGIVTGTSLHYVSSFIISMLDLDRSPEEQRGQSLASYRVEKRERAHAEIPILEPRQKQRLPNNDLGLREEYMDWNTIRRSRERVGIRINTIIEEEDSSDCF